MKGLLKKTVKPDSSWEPGRVSEMILDFARLLLEAEPGGPPDLTTVRNIMQIVNVCWNQPVYEGAGDSLGVEGKKMLDSAMRVMPERIRTLLEQLLRDRRTRFGGVPFLVLVIVTGESLADARIIAEAREAPRSVRHIG